MKRIALCIGSRANWGSGKAVARAIAGHPKLELHGIAFASALLDEYGGTAQQMRVAGVDRLHEVHCQVSGDGTADMVRTVAAGLPQFAGVFDRIKPDVVYVIGDRHEVLAPAMAAAYMNITLAHQMGGEVSGSIDDKVRNAITAMADLHFVASDAALERVQDVLNACTLAASSAHVTGCPRIDLVRETLSGAVVRTHSDGRPFVMVSQHAVTTEAQDAGQQMRTTLSAVAHFRQSHDLDIFWPNADPGGHAMAHEIRLWLMRDSSNVRTHRAMPPEDYWRLMAGTACLIGNSSSAIREGAFIGTPAVNIGTRQRGRSRAENVIDCEPREEAIVSAIARQLACWRGRAFKPSTLYGDGHAAERIVEVLAQ